MSCNPTPFFPLMVLFYGEYEEEEYKKEYNSTFYQIA